MPNEEPEPKLIIDEDWKTQVEREKNVAAAKAATESSDAESTAELKPKDQAAQTPTENKTATEASPQMPPASFDFLVTMLATQALVSLGQMPGADGKPQPVDKPLAKHYIDLLGVIEKKTEGNLDASETKLLSEIMHSLRMMFVQSK